MSDTQQLQGETHSHQVFLAAKHLVDLVEQTPNPRARASVAVWVVGYISRKVKLPVLTVGGDPIQRIVNAFLVAEDALDHSPLGASEPRVVATVAEGVLRLVGKLSDEDPAHTAR